MKSCSPWTSISLMLLLLFCSVKASAQTQPLNLTDEMVDAVQTFRNSLLPAQLEAASYDFDDEERLNWHFIPRPRNGLSFNEMNAAQQALAEQLLGTFLGDSGYRKVKQIRSLENVLREIETNGRFDRDPNAYFLTVFGTPSMDGAWALRLEGHHVALNWTFAGGSGIASTPQFFGSNPAEVRSGPLRGLRVLAAEEDLARQLLLSLDAEQRSLAVLERQVPRDILTGAEVDITPLEATGIDFNSLDSPQRLNLMNLIEEVASTQAEAVSDQRMAQVRAGREQIRFTWIGATGAADPHYWRIQGDDFLIEYDKTQNDANHIHLVWRDFDGDFGEDLLRQHYQAIATAYGPGHRH